MIYLRLFYEFFKTGLFSVGGGLATIPFLSDMGARTGWFTSGDLANMIAVAESTPGPIGVNMATYVGYTAGGVLGAVIATLALVMPSIIVIIIVAKLLQKYKENFYVNSAFYGLRPASLALITCAGLEVMKAAFVTSGIAFSFDKVLSFFNYKAIILAAVIFIVMRKTKFHTIVYVAFAALVGIVFKFAS